MSSYTDESDLNMESIFTPPSNASDSVKGSPETLIEMRSKVKLESLLRRSTILSRAKTVVNLMLRPLLQMKMI